MRRGIFGIVAAVSILSACATPQTAPRGAAGPVEVKIIAFNDFHGAL